MDPYNPLSFIFLIILIVLGFFTIIYLSTKLKYFILGFKRAGDFSGRSNRKEFWYFFLFNIIMQGVLMLIEGSRTREDSVLVGLYGFIVALPFISLFIRRMHDIDKRGWFILIPIWNLIFTFFKGTKGNNRFGPESKN